ncbi:ABC transporter ATP-binding protein [Bordetella sp. BOR01]|nr:ABC transporter ATP-binding protein [Bordetella sp. BOR01]
MASIPSRQLPEPRAGVVHMRGVGRRFDGRDVLAQIDLDIGQGEFVALIGRSGSGKSTLLRILSGLDTGASGSVQADLNAGYVFQDARLVPWKRVWENITLGLRAPRRKRREIAAAALAEVWLADKIDAYPATLSGGQAQRVAICRALLRRPRLLLLDEPFGALDALTRMQMQTLVADLWTRHRMAALLVTHDVEEAILLADRVLVLEQGRIVARHDIRLPRPRSRTQADILPLREQLLDGLGLEKHET